MNQQPEKNKPPKKKILEPTLNFVTEHIKIGEDDLADKIPVTELVPAGHLLAHFPNFEKFSLRGYEKAPLEHGENTSLTSDEESIIASVPGYPKVKKIRSKEFSELITLISIEPLFIITHDKMKVTVALHPILKRGKSLKDFDIHTLLTEQGIQYGIDPAALSEVQHWLDEGENEFTKCVLARGKPVGKSTDAYLRFNIEIGPIAGTVMKNGSIDYRERRIMVGVNKDQSIATKIPAIQGPPGVDIFGEETPAPEGKDLIIRILNDARFSKESMEVTATKDGVLSVVNNNVIKVLSHQTIHSDIDYETGNVESQNCLTIHGSVQPGFKVTAKGDVKITGGIMSGKVNCESNLVVQGGITGKNSQIAADGDVDLLFIEQGVLKCGGLCVLRKQSYYSTITSGSSVRCKDQGKVVGGEIVAEGDVTLYDIGAENASPSLIAAGVVAERLHHLNELKQSVIDQQEEIIKWLQRYRGSAKSKKIRKMEEKLAETKMLVLRVNLVPGTGIYSRVAGPVDEKMTSSGDYDARGGIAIDKIKIDIHGTVYAGTELRIGNRNIKLEKTVSSRQFRLQPNGKRIIAVPISK